jgi:hypothetical protein
MGWDGAEIMDYVLTNTRLRQAQEDPEPPPPEAGVFGSG